MSKALVLHRAGEFIRAKRTRANCRSTLAKLRKKWYVDYETYYEKGDEDERTWWTETEYELSRQIEAALIERTELNKRYRRALHALDKLFGKSIS